MGGKETAVSMLRCAVCRLAQLVSPGVSYTSCTASALRVLSTSRHRLRPRSPPPTHPPAKEQPHAGTCLSRVLRMLTHFVLHEHKIFATRRQPTQHQPPKAPEGFPPRPQEQRLRRHRRRDWQVT